MRARRRMNFARWVIAGDLDVIDDPEVKALADQIGNITVHLERTI